MNDYHTRENKNRARQFIINRAPVTQGRRLSDNRHDAIVQKKFSTMLNHTPQNRLLAKLSRRPVNPLSIVIQRTFTANDIQCTVTKSLTAVVTKGIYKDKEIGLGKFRNYVNPGDRLVCNVVNGSIVQITKDLTREKERKEEEKKKKIEGMLSGFFSRYNTSNPFSIAGSTKKHTSEKTDSGVRLQIISCLKNMNGFRRVGCTRDHKGNVFTFTANISRNIVTQYVAGPDKGNWTIIGQLEAWSDKGQAKTALRVWHHGPG